MCGGRVRFDRGVAGDEVGATLRKMPAKLALGVRPKVYDQLEAVEPALKIGSQRRRGVELSPTGLGLRMHVIEYTRNHAEFGCAGIAGELDSGRGPALAEQLKGGHGDEKIAERAAAQDEDALPTAV